MPTRRTTSSPRLLNSRRNCATSAVVRSSLFFAKALRAKADVIHATVATETNTVKAKISNSFLRNFMVCPPTRYQLGPNVRLHRPSSRARLLTPHMRPASAAGERLVPIATGCARRRRVRRLNLPRMLALAIRAVVPVGTEPHAHLAMPAEFVAGADPQRLNPPTATADPHPAH